MKSETEPEEKCKDLFVNSSEEIKRFKERIGKLGRTSADTVIVIINVDDENYGGLGELLMPGHNWQQYRDKGLIPYAKGLVTRECIQSFLDATNERASDALSNMAGVVVAVFDCGIVALFAA